MQEIYKNIFKCEDSCNVYIIKYGECAILIDPGSGAVLKKLAEINIHKIEAVYFTAPRRDRTAGLNELPDNSEVFWPKEAENYIKKFSLIDADIPMIHPKFPGIYEVSRFRNINYQVAKLTDYKGIRLTPVPAAEGLCGSSYAIDIDGKIICFSGDCIFSKNKFYNAYNMEHFHHTGLGQREAAHALDTLRLTRPDILCPAHGDVISGFEDIEKCLCESKNKLLELSELYFNSCLETSAAKRIDILSEKNGFHKLGKKLYIKGSTHVLLSEGGNALLVDFNSQGREFVEEWVSEFKKCFGKNCIIEKVLISHRHYDHWAGINELRKFYDISVECIEYMADDMEHPLARKRPFSFEPGVKIDKRLKDGEEFSWHEYDFTAYYFPGQTDMHSGYYTDVEGVKVFYTGDNFYPPQQWGGTGGFSSFNGGDPKRGWLKSINILLEIEPDYILCGHSHPYIFRKEEFINRRKWVDAITEKMKEVSPYVPFEVNFDQHVFEAYPYTQKVNDSFTIKIIFKNYDNNRHFIKVKPVMPVAVSCEHNDYIKIEAEANSINEAEFNFKKNGKLSQDKMITFDIYYDERYLGERLEAFIY